MLNAGCLFRSLTNEEIHVNKLQFGILFYLCISFGLAAFIMRVAKKMGRDLSKTLLSYIVLFGPIMVVINLILDILYPPSKDPFDLVYVHLSFAEGKDSLQILREIKDTGETIGWGASSRIESLLQAMVIMGHARSKVVPQKRQELDASTSDVYWVSENVEVDMSPEFHEKAKQTTAKLEEAERNQNNEDLGTVTLYYRGVPPKKGGKKFFCFIPVSRPGFAWQH